MKRIALFVVIAGIMVLATACGVPASAATQASAQPAATQAPTQSIATQIPTQPVATEVPASSVSGSVVNITLADNTIESSLTTFQVGVPYTFAITNAGRHAHNFNISTPVSVAGSLQAALSTALLAVDQTQLNPGATVTVDYTFPDTAAGAQLEFSCLIKRHYEDGMLLLITVTK